MAVIGKARAVAEIGRFACGGFLAWLLWGGVHIAFLIGFRNRALVLFQWSWNWLWDARDARLITGGGRLDIREPRLDGHDVRGDAGDPAASEALARWENEGGRVRAGEPTT